MALCPPETIYYIGRVGRRGVVLLSCMRNEHDLAMHRTVLNTSQRQSSSVVAGLVLLRSGASSEGLVHRRLGGGLGFFMAVAVVSYAPRPML